MESLREKKLVHTIFGSDARVPRYKHMLTEFFALNPPEVAVLCVLMLRGAQTVGEIKGRTNRLFEFAELSEVEATLEGLIAREPHALAVKLPRQVGQKEVRYAHLLAGPVTVEDAVNTVRLEPATLKVQVENERIRKLEAEVEDLRQQLGALQRQFEDFRTQFE